MDAGLYVHVPFCYRKCGYCDFFSVEPDGVDEYVDAVLAEARMRAPTFGRFQTLYLGGGTPSVLPRASLQRLAEGLRETCELAPDAEVTLEANPDDVTPEAARHWRSLGFDRLSLGVQSLQDDVLRWLGRRHDAGQALRAIGSIRDAGFANLGLDLIWGIPGQSADGWTATLERAVAERPEHLSCYQLTLEPHTPLGRSEDGHLPGEERARQQFVSTSQQLRESGFEHYEVSNFARGSRSRHNHLCWTHVPYLGLGPSAHSFDGRRRWWNVSSVPRYTARVLGDVSPASGSEQLDDHQLGLEALMLGLRTSDGVSMDVVRRFTEWEQTVGALQEEGLVEVDGAFLRPTLEGLLLADGIPLRFGEPTSPSVVP